MVPKKHIDPIAQFMQEHDAALQHLSSLNKATRSLAEHGYSEEAFRKVAKAMDFINDEVTIHNRSEEEALFPVLERYVEGPTERMREDHRLLKKEFVRLQKAVNRVSAKPDSRAAIERLATISRTVVQIFVNHIHKENHILFPIVQKFLTKDALREVARRML